MLPYVCNIGTIGTDGITNGTIGKTLNGICLPIMVPFYHWKKLLTHALFEILNKHIFRFGSCASLSSVFSPLLFLAKTNFFYSDLQSSKDKLTSLGTWHRMSKNYSDILTGVNQITLHVLSSESHNCMHIPTHAKRAKIIDSLKTILYDFAVDRGFDVEDISLARNGRSQSGSEFS